MFTVKMQQFGLLRIHLQLLVFTGLNFDCHSFVTHVLLINVHHTDCIKHLQLFLATVPCFFALVDN